MIYSRRVRHCRLVQHCQLGWGSSSSCIQPYYQQQRPHCLQRSLPASPPSNHAAVAVGTIAYCSPEQLLGLKCGFASDIYSFGVVSVHFACLNLAILSLVLPLRSAGRTAVSLAVDGRACAPRLSTLPALCCLQLLHEIATQATPVRGRMRPIRVRWRPVCWLTTVLSSCCPLFVCHIPAYITLLRSIQALAHRVSLMHNRSLPQVPEEAPAEVVGLINLCMRSGAHPG